MISLAFLLLAAAQPKVAPKVMRPDSDWLTGIWIETDESRSLERCGSWDAVGFYADGNVSQWDWEGSWRLDGDRLIEEARNGFTPDRLESRVVRLGPNEFRRITAEGEKVTMIRCPKPETPIAR